VTNIITTMTDRPFFADLSGVSGAGIGLSAPGLLPVGERSERPTRTSSAVVAGQAYALAVVNGDGKQHTYHTWMRAFRGLEPWSDPT
jgi:hypothetical protein